MVAVLPKNWLAPPTISHNQANGKHSRSHKQFTVFNIIFSNRNEKNIIESAAQGASVAIGLVANIGANLIAFFAFLAFLNSILSYLGSLVLHPELSFEVQQRRLRFENEITQQGLLAGLLGWEATNPQVTPAKKLPEDMILHTYRVGKSFQLSLNSFGQDIKFS